MTNNSKQEIVSEIALQLLPTMYGKVVDFDINSGIAYYKGWLDDFAAESFELAEAYYAYKEKYLKE